MCSSFEKITKPVECKVSETIEDVGSEAIKNMAASIWQGATETTGSLGTMWVDIKTVNLTGSGGGSPLPAGSAAENASREFGSVLGYVLWISLAIAILSLFVLGALLATRMRRGEGIMAVGRLGWILGGVLLISTASALFLQSRLWWYMGTAAVIGAAGMVWGWTGCSSLRMCLET